MLLVACGSDDGTGAGGAAGGGGSAGSAGSASWYVSKNGDDADGRSWATAWSELANIEWSKIGPGEIVEIDGGETEMVYTSTLTVGQSGIATAPIIVRASVSEGHSGQVVLFGGRTTPLPYCACQDYVYEESGVSQTGIDVGDHAYLVFDGMRAGGIVIKSHNGPGILPAAGSDHVTFRNMELFDNGTAFRGGFTDGAPYSDPNGPWNPIGPNVELIGTNLTFERINSHDAGEDSFQSAGGFAELTLRQVWLHNERQHPTAAGPTDDWGAPGPAAFNLCAHTDGIQVYAGGTMAGITIESSVLGPGLGSAVIVGDGGLVNDVTLVDTLLISAAAQTSESGVTGWRLTNVTAYTPVCSALIYGTGNSITNSVFYGGCLTPPEISFTNNCWWDTSDSWFDETNTNADPLFVGPFPPASSSFQDLAAVDFALQSGSPCTGKGSQVTSVAKLLQTLGY